MDLYVDFASAGQFTAHYRDPCFVTGLHLEQAVACSLYVDEDIARTNPGDDALGDACQRLRVLFGVLGDQSYPIYATHWPLIAIAHPMIMKLHLPALPAALSFLVFLLH